MQMYFSDRLRFARIILLTWMAGLGGLPDLAAQVMQVRVSNITRQEGEVLVAVYDSEQNWLKTPVVSGRARATGGTLDFSFDLKEGRYALSVFHDRNGNGKLDTGLFGAPSEPIGFSNGYKPWGPPNYKKAEVRFQKGASPVEVRLYSFF